MVGTSVRVQCLVSELWKWRFGIVGRCVLTFLRSIANRWSGVGHFDYRGQERVVFLMLYGL